MAAHQLQENYRNLENDYFLYEGKPILKSVRLKIAKYSLHKAALRIENQRLRRIEVDALEEDEQVIKALDNQQNYNISLAQFADPSGITRGVPSPDNKLFATAGGSGECRVWDIETTQELLCLKGHLGKCHSIAFHPQSTLTLPYDSQANIASASADLSIKLWRLQLNDDNEEQKQQHITLKGHEDRVNQVMYHQLGTQILSVSYDKTWKMWDIETQQELLTQTGHSRAVYSCSLHPDGSLFFTGDLGGQGMLWDLRTGKGILPISGHVKGILCSDFNQNGYHLVTGGDENNIRIWDIRRGAHLYKIPAHLKLISSLKCYDGKFILSASYDGTIKFWNARDFQLSKTYDQPDEKINSVHLANQYMVSTTIDRKFVVWK